MYLHTYTYIYIKQNCLCWIAVSEKMVTNWLISLILYLTIQSFGGTNKKSVHFVDSIESDTQAYTLKKNPPQNHRHCTARIYGL